MFRSIALWGLAEAIATYGFATHMGHSTKSALEITGALLVGPPVLFVLLGILARPVVTFMAIRAERRRISIEARYPRTRVTALSKGKWLVTDLDTGKTRCVLERDGVSVADQTPAKLWRRGRKTQVG
ncbi:hypothetical protein KDX16_15655 [Burkholderia vietnamiensis]|jgi:hypothetical protein|uniref:Uncharacterized protein n=2 Tax=Burkholderia cepacia complex TaxID=87882 RepID=A0A228HLJ9_9BURK|nr:MULTISPECIES: hypothetical protein [Burkholderia]HDR9761520.1 hypothetical protein [Burkholderia cepacia ATCC 25416]MBR7917259.1 hypothetical protein [Burkholderia vietnamiensis]MBR8054737.1 hypothetical protein [Burkholderia vietnamiensis]MDN7570594.1 hypothetical protein [Burkholderia contaminans]OXI30958.1 hypothetical protein CFB84_43125 [Burkholderia aenigmatica]